MGAGLMSMLSGLVKGATTAGGGLMDMLKGGVTPIGAGSGGFGAGALGGGPGIGYGGTGGGFGAGALGGGPGIGAGSPSGGFGKDKLGGGPGIGYEGLSTTTTTPAPSKGKWKQYAQQQDVSAGLAAAKPDNPMYDQMMQQAQQGVVNNQGAQGNQQQPQRQMMTPAGMPQMPGAVHPNATWDTLLKMLSGGG